MPERVTKTKCGGVLREKFEGGMLERVKKMKCGGGGLAGKTLGGGGVDHTKNLGGGGSVENYVFLSGVKY